MGTHVFYCFYYENNHVVNLWVVSVEFPIVQKVLEVMTRSRIRGQPTKQTTESGICK